MKKWLPWIIVGLCVAWLAVSLRMPADKGFDYTRFGRIPLIAGGRVQPLDSLARNTLLQLREKQTANLEPWKSDPKIISADEWLLAVMTRPDEADKWPEFRIDNPDLKGLLGLPADPDPTKQLDGKHFSWAQIQPHLSQLSSEQQRAKDLQDNGTNDVGPYLSAVLHLWDAQALYSQLKLTFGPAAKGDLLGDIGPYVDKIRAGIAANDARTAGKTSDDSALIWLNQQAQTPFIVPPAPNQKDSTWLPVVAFIAQAGQTGDSPNFAIIAFNDMAKASRANDAGAFNAAVKSYLDGLSSTGLSKEISKGSKEQYFNFIEPFYKAMIIYICALLLVLAYWFRPGAWEWLRVTAVGLVVVALVVHTSGLLARMLLEGRPPVTNLYSSAIFIGWGATVLGLILEKFWRNSIGIMVSCVIGFSTLIIAHHLQRSGDTMEMMRAVLDNNFWLATHVVVVTLGYASTFVAGVLGIIYVVMGMFTEKLSNRTSKGLAAGAPAGGAAPARRAAGDGEAFGRSLNRMIYGIICFATLFSFVGTVLGGIWADQSWGRFWGWDPKENGALIIVLWNAIVLHARWGGMVRERGLAVMAVGGNIVTSWSWFGVNMLGIGLHSYGFTSAAFVWLVAFVASQVALIILGVMPKRYWQSFAAGAKPEPELPGGKGKTVPAGAR